MSEKTQIHLTKQEQQIIREILQKNIPNRTVWAFGSRVNGNPKPYSDLDLAILGNTPLSLAEHANLADDFSQSDLIWKVDLVDWCLIGNDFRKIIEQSYFVFQAA